MHYLFYSIWVKKTIVLNVNIYQPPASISIATVFV